MNSSVPPDSPWSQARPRPPSDRNTREREAKQRGEGRSDGPGNDAPRPYTPRSESPTSRPGAGAGRPAGDRPPSRQARPPRAPERGPSLPPATATETQRAAYPGNRNELRVYGMNAIRAIFARRPEAIRKLYLLDGRIPQLQPLLAWCVQNKVGYRVVEPADLDKLAASSHHEGVVADVLREDPPLLANWLADLPAGPQLLLWLEGVGNPHNFGAILRSAAHFGVTAILLPADASLSLSGAAARVAEGGAEQVALVRLGGVDDALKRLRAAGFLVAATVVREGQELYTADLPERLVYVLGAEGEGLTRHALEVLDVHLAIPGSGRVDSLNVAAATAVFLAEWHRRHAGAAWA